MIVVDAGGGGAFTQIQPAIDAAQDGDVVLVKSGSYSTFVVDGRSLSIIGDLGATVQVSGAIRAVNLLSNQTFVLENVVATGTTPSDPILQHGLWLKDCAGHVRVERCTLDGRFTTYCCDPLCSGCSSGLLATSVADLGLIACSLHGGRVHLRSEDGGAIITSTAVFFDSDFGGADGQNVSCGYGNSGGSGCFARDSTLRIFNCSFQGGRGGNTAADSIFNCPDAGYGGDGILLISSPGHSCRTTVFDSFAAGGAAGTIQGMCGGACGFSGHPGVSYNGTPFEFLAGSARTMISPTPVRENTSPVLNFTGQPGDQVLLLISHSTQAQYVPQWLGTLLLDLTGSPQVVQLGFIGGNGSVQVSLPIPNLGGGEQSQVLYLQPMFIDTQGRRRLGTPSCMVVLDSAF